MSPLWVATIGASIICYLLKVLGYSIPDSKLANPRIQRINELVPVVLLSALVATQTFTTESMITIDHRLAGVTAAVVALKMRLSFPIMMLLAATTSALIYNLA